MLTPSFFSLQGSVAVVIAEAKIAEVWKCLLTFFVKCCGNKLTSNLRYLNMDSSKCCAERGTYTLLFSYRSIKLRDVFKWYFLSFETWRIKD